MPQVPRLQQSSHTPSSLLFRGFASPFWFLIGQLRGGKCIYISVIFGHFWYKGLWGHTLFFVCRTLAQRSFRVKYLKYDIHPARVYMKVRMVSFEIVLVNEKRVCECRKARGWRKEGCGRWCVFFPGGRGWGTAMWSADVRSRLHLAWLKC